MTFFRMSIAAALAAAALGPAQGRPSIVGGHDITIADAPWQLLFQIQYQGGQGQCAASWIGGRWALTAAHCVEDATPDISFVYAGITKRSQATSKTRLKVTRIIANPDFPKTWKDVALLELASDITSPLAHPIPFATPVDSKRGLTNPGVTVVMTGWGGVDTNGHLAETLQSLTTTIRDTAKYVLDFVPRNASPDQGSCGGDSGGPAVVKDASGEGWIVAGISSYIQGPCGDTKTPSSYTRVSVFASWIQQNTGMVTGGIDPRQVKLAPPLSRGIIHLDHPQHLEMVFLNLAGAAVARSSGDYPAGEFPAPSGLLPAGTYLLQLKSAQLDVAQSIRILR